MTKKNLRILSLDPGTYNYGYSIIEVYEDGDWSLLKSGRIHTTLKVMNSGMRDQSSGYAGVIRSLVRDHFITHVIAERYMSRRMGGTTIECVNAMLGITMAVCDQLRVFLKVIPSSQWKNEAGRRNEFLLEDMYQSGKENRITPHTIDAVMIGLYGKSVVMNEVAFDGIREADVVGPILSVGLTDIGELVRKVPKKRRRKSVR